MRDIKFRAWHVENKTMVNFDNEKVIKDQYQMAHLCELISGTHPDGELMQFTGLTDTNGVDIYESDVLKQTYEDGDVFGVVKYVMAEGGYITEGIDEIKDYPLCFNAYYSGKSEIVGNIHSNPELLEQ